jgi:hypothetical protein
VRRPTRAAKPRGHVDTRLEQRVEAPARPTALLVSLGGRMLFRAPCARLPHLHRQRRHQLRGAGLRSSQQSGSAWYQSKGAGERSEAVELKRISCSVENRGQASATSLHTASWVGHLRSTGSRRTGNSGRGVGLHADMLCASSQRLCSRAAGAASRQGGGAQAEDNGCGQARHLRSGDGRVVLRCGDVALLHCQAPR